jgi:conjugative relaxase-like TrwC/TraI family protein
MLSRGKITAGSARYYTEKVASGIEDYLSGRGEAPGVWEGSGAAAEHLVGEVTPDHVSRLFESGDARHPTTASLLGATYKVADGVDKVMGWDLTLSAPKSFSALWAVADEPLRRVLDEVHGAAVREAVAYLEDHAAFSRTGRGGVAQVDTTGLVIARFDHRMSRAQDPQRHSHLLVSNRVRCSDGKWRALDSKALHPQLKPAGTMYHAALRAESTARLGIVWHEPSADGQADIAGVPEGLVRSWSKRRRAIERDARERIARREVDVGRPVTDAERRELYQQATLDTRGHKDHDAESAPTLHDRWRQEAADAGFEASRWLPAVLEARIDAPPLDVEWIVVDVLAALETAHSTWARSDVVVEIAARLPAAAARSAAETRALVERLAGEVLSDDHVVRLAAPPLPRATGFARRDGQSVFEHHNARRYTTRYTLALEANVLDFAAAGRDSGRGVANTATVDAVLPVHGLSGDQADAVRRLTLGGDALVCLVGPAGTGKTRTVGAAADIWQTDDIPVRGLAVSAVAADVLAAEAGIRTDTVAKLLYEYDRPGGPRPEWRLRRGEILIVDEASHVPTLDFARLVDLASAHEAKIAAAGDHRQLGAVDAGGLFRLLVNDASAVELTDIWRFRNEWEKEASLRLRRRDATVLGEYDAHGRLEGGTRDDMLERGFEHWAAARAAGESVVVVAQDHATVDDLAMRIRASRIRNREVEPVGIDLEDQVVGCGDEIVTLLNDRRLVTSNQRWVRNGDRWNVERRTRRGALLVSSLDGRGAVWLPPAYVEENVALAYAVTLHKAQGMTVDRGVVLADASLTDLGLYVGMTRGRATNHALVTCDLDNGDHHALLPTPVDVLSRVLARDAAERSATEVLRDELTAEWGYVRNADRLDYFDRDVSRNFGDSETWPDDHDDVALLRNELVDRLRDAVEDVLRQPPNRTRSVAEDHGAEIDLGP